MDNAFNFTISTTRFDDSYQPSNETRITTNFANLARGERRIENLRGALRMINNRFNALAHWDNPKGSRYQIDLDIISVSLEIENTVQGFPLIEVLQTKVQDHQSDTCIASTIGNNFSSYVRDYDFSVVLPEHNRGKERFSVPETFGELHGNLFKAFVASNTYKAHFDKPPVICLSVSESKTYAQGDLTHRVLGAEYHPDSSSLTERYFQKMGLKVRYFMPPNSTAPLAFFFTGDLLRDYNAFELLSTISTMESFQKIYRPEIYNANATAGKIYKPDLAHPDYSLTRITYDREERARLAKEQGQFAAEHFIEPNLAALEHWSSRFDLARSSH